MVHQAASPRMGGRGRVGGGHALGPGHDKGGEAGQGMVHQAASPGVGGRGQVGLPLVAVVGTGVAAVTNRE